MLLQRKSSYLHQPSSSDNVVFISAGASWADAFLMSLHGSEKDKSFHNMASLEYAQQIWNVWGKTELSFPFDAQVPWNAFKVGVISLLFNPSFDCFSSKPQDFILTWYAESTKAWWLYSHCTIPRQALNSFLTSENKRRSLIEECTPATCGKKMYKKEVIESVPSCDTTKLVLTFLPLLQQGQL